MKSWNHFLCAFAVACSLAAPAFAQARGDGGSSEAWEAVQFFREGRSLHRSGKLERASEYYKRALQTDPGRIEVLPYLALVLDKLGKYEEAEHCCDEYLEAEPQDTAVIFNKAVILFHHGDYDSSFELVNKLGSKMVTVSQYHVLRGMLNLHDGNYADAAESFNTALAIEPNNCDAASGLASSLMQQGKYDEAAAVLRRALSDHPRNPIIANNWGVYLADNGNSGEALSFFEKASDDLPIAAVNALIVHNGDDFLLRAADLCDKNPDLLEASVLYAAALYKAERWDEALEEFLKDKSSFSLEYAGLCCLHLKKYAEACSYLREAAQKEPCARNFHNLSLALYSTDPAEALAFARRAYRLEPNSSDIVYNLAYILDIGGDAKEALHYYEAWLNIEHDVKLEAQVQEHIKEIKPKAE